MIGAGDFASVHEGLEETIDALADIDKPTILVPGNNETEEALREAVAELGRGDRPARLPAPRSTASHFYGLGAGIPITPWDWSFDLDDEAGGGALADCPTGAVLVLHSPPQGHCDESSAGDHLGSPALATAIERAAAAARRLRPHPRELGRALEDRRHRDRQPRPGRSLLRGLRVAAAGVGDCAFSALRARRRGR